MKRHILTILLMIMIMPQFVMAKEYPNASGIVLLDSTTITLQKDMKVVKERYLRIKILEKRGRSVFGDIKERYDKDFQKFEIIKAQTVLPSGKIIKPEEDAISDVSAPEVGFAAQYTNVLMKVVSFPALDPGVIIEYHYKISSKKSLTHPLFADVIFQGTEPIKKKIFTIIFPDKERKRFHQKFIGRKVRPIIEQLDDYMVSYTFTLKDIPKIIVEPNMPSISEIAPKLLFTFYDLWEDFGKWYGKKFYKSAKVDKDIKSMAEKLRGQNSEKHIENIVHFVKQKIRNIHLSFGDSGYNPNKAKKVLNNMYGDPQDKAVLLVSLLKAAGIDAYPVLVLTPKWGYFSIVGLSRSILNMNSSLPVPSQFNSVLVAIKHNGNIQFVSPMGQFNRYGWLSHEYQGRDGLIIKKRRAELITLPVTDEQDSKSELNLNAKIDKQGNLKGTYELNTTGYYDNKLRDQLRYKNKDELDILFKSVVNQIRGGSKLITYELTNPEDLDKDMKIKIVFESPKYATFQKSKVRFNIPRLSISGAGVENYSSLSERNHELMLWSKRTCSYNANIEIPEGFKVQYIPKNEKQENDYAGFTIKSNKSENSIILNYRFIIRKQKVDNLGYKDFKKLQDEYFNREKWSAVCSK